MVLLSVYNKLTPEEKAEFDRITTGNWNQWVFKSSHTSDGAEFEQKYTVRQTPKGQWAIVSIATGEATPYQSTMKSVIEAVFGDIACNYGR